MGTYTDYHGTLTIEPPLTWPEIRQSEAWPGHPDHCNGYPGTSTRYGTRLIVEEATLDTSEGSLTRRTATGVKISGEELRHDGVMDDLRVLARQFGDTHRFVGVLDCRHDHPDVETPFRVRIVGTEVQEVWPVMFWPDDQGDKGALRRIRITLGRHSGVELDDADDIAAKVLATLVTNYTQKG